MTEPDLASIARQIERILAEMAGARDDMRILTSVALRLDRTSMAVLAEWRVINAQIARMNDRATKLESEA